MIKNHLKIAFRQMGKQKFYSIVNIMGLAIGVTCCLLIALYVQDELSFDKYHPNVENLYRLGRDIKMEDFEEKVLIVSAVLPKEMMAQIPEVKNYARITESGRNGGSNLVRKVNETNNLYEDGFVYADQSLFEMFHLPLVYGDKNNILTKPRTIVVSEKMAQKYFPNKNPVGEALVLNNSNEEIFTITGVMENIPEQTHLQADFFISMPTLPASDTSNTYLNNSYYAYVTLTEGTQPAQLESKFYDFVHQNFAPQFKQFVGIEMKEMEQDGKYLKLFLQPVEEAHLKSTELWPAPSTIGDIRQVRLFGSIAIFILLIALFNFINLSTARSANRAKEVGLRKVLGSYQKQLVSQFLTESVLMSLFAFGIGFFFAIFLLPSFNEVTAKAIEIPFAAPGFVVLFVGSTLLVGFLAGLYPAFYLSKFQPVKVLKGKLSLGSKSSWLQSGLVIFQFTISISLIVGTLVVKKQMDFIENKNLGFDKNQVLILQDTYTLGDQLPEFKEALKKIPEVENVSSSSFLPLEGGSRSYFVFHPEHKTAAADQVQLQTWTVDEDYVNTLNINLINGRDFNLEIATDSMGVILNETAAQALAGGADPIGMRIITPASPEDFYTVVGVVEDFHYKSLKGKIDGLGLFFGNNIGSVSIRSTAAEMDQLIAKTEAVWKSFAPMQPFRYDFMDDRFARMYESDGRVGSLFSIFSMLAIFIACLGLLALATFMTEQRMKEIGIRKILGASVPNIVFQLSKSFLLYVFIGLLIAIPIAWIQMNNWLENFAYRIDVEWWMFAVAGMLAIGIALLTVGSKTMIAAMTNPVESLRNE
ncbi:MAG: putative ABC transport system permease protein [Granulosicoccus sp.]|jgi:putative ABC transport system permease protein